jgi:hypothetical protein
MLILSILENDRDARGYGRRRLRRLKARNAAPRHRKHDQTERDERSHQKVVGCATARTSAMMPCCKCVLPIAIQR